MAMTIDQHNTSSISAVKKCPVTISLRNEEWVNFDFQHCQKASFANL